jgi:cysteinyl-tRNA synthetase
MFTLKNTLTRKRETLAPGADGLLRMYVCGPTVYDDAHLGHARCYITWDSLYRLLCVLYGEANVVFARNVTDVDDKILKRAAEQNTTPHELTTRYYARFLEDLDALHCKRPNLEPKATEHIAGMQAIVYTLLAKGMAYTASDGTVYYAVETKADYGKLSGRKLEEQQAGARVEVELEKHHPADFALWKPAENPDELAWEDETTPEQQGQSAPLKRGRPGWHIECSAMIQAVFGGVPIELHAGGQDLMFPHHENEIAQSEGCCGTGHFVKHWVHNGFVNVSGDKMGKSLGNFKTVRDLLAQNYTGNAIRYFVLSQKYDKPIDFTEADLNAAQTWVERFLATWQEMWALVPEIQKSQVTTYPVLEDLNEELYQDLNTPLLLGELNARLKSLRQLKSGSTTQTLVTPEFVQVVGSVYSLAVELLGFELPLSTVTVKRVEPFSLATQECVNQLVRQFNVAVEDMASTEVKIEQLIAHRNQGLAQAGLVLTDTRQGTTYSYTNV